MYTINLVYLIQKTYLCDGKADLLAFSVILCVYSKMITICRFSAQETFLIIVVTYFLYFKMF